MRGQLAVATLACVATTIAWASGGAAQAPQQPPPQPPTFRAGANLVRVDVSVNDRHGDPVTDLQQDDFEVREEGVPQTVATFKLVEANGEAPDESSLPIRSVDHARAEAARDDIRVFVVFWDEYHIAGMVPAIQGRKALADFMRNAFGPADLVALVDQLTSIEDIRFTRDRFALADAVRRLRGRQGVYFPPRGAIEEAQIGRLRDIEVLRAQVTTSAIEATILHLGEIREGRKAILLVSQDIGPLPLGDRERWLGRAIRLAKTNNTVIYTLDPRGLMINGRMSGVLQSLATETGGRWYQSNEPAPHLRSIVKEASAFYLLGYASTLNPEDGKFHRISVRVKRPGVSVRARSGYYAPSSTAVEEARAASAASVLPPDIERAFDSLSASRPDTPGDLWVGATRSEGGQPRVTIAWSPRDPKRASSASIRATAADGTICFDGPIPVTGASFAAAPGPLSLERTTAEADGTVGDRERTTFNVPEFASALSMSSPVLLRARSPSELRALSGNAAAVPYAGHTFDRTDRLILRFSVFGSAADAATVTAGLVGRKGTALSVLPLTKLPGASGDYELQLPLSSVGRGDYLISIEASQGAERAKALVPFRTGAS